MLIWFLRGLPSDNSKLHWLQLKVWIKCLSIKAGGEGSWGKNRNQTQTLKGSEGAGSEARNTARSQRYCCRVLSDGLLQSIMPLLFLKQPPTALHKTCHYVTQSITLGKTASHFHRCVTYDHFQLEPPPEMTHGITNRELWCFAFKIQYHWSKSENRPHRWVSLYCRSPPQKAENLCRVLLDFL